MAVSHLQLQLPVHETPGASSQVGAPPVAVLRACSTAPRTRLSNLGLRRRYPRSRGSAIETQCAGVSEAVFAKERITRVRISVARQLRRHRCAFLQRNGRLSAARSSTRVIRPTARRGAHWFLHMTFRHPLPAGRYLINLSATDAAGHTEAANVRPPPTRLAPARLMGERGRTSSGDCVWFDGQQ